MCSRLLLMMLADILSLITRCVEVEASMTIGAQHDEVVCGIASTVSAEQLMVDLKVGHRPTVLAAPSVTLEHGAIYPLITAVVLTSVLHATWPCCERLCVK